MLPVEIMQTQGTVILRARSSELLILPHHVRELKGLSEARDFSEYFTREALVNRPARKLFEAWLRKDRTLWPRLFKVIHRDIDMKDVAAAEEAIERNLAGKSDLVPATVVEAPVEKKAAKVQVQEAPIAEAKPKIAAKSKAAEAPPEASKPTKAIAAKTTKGAASESEAKAKKPIATKKAATKKVAAAAPVKKTVKKTVAKKAATASKAQKSKKGD